MAWRYLRGAAVTIFLGTGIGTALPAAGQARQPPLAQAPAIAFPSALPTAFAITFHIPAGPAGAAIDAFARQADVNVLASGELLAGRHSEGLRGTFTVPDGLARLLAGTGLRARTSPGGSIFIERAPVPPPAAPDPARGTLPTVPDVIVLGTRAAQQSSIIEKRFAPTAIDVVVAQDVGSFPDRNVAEAISRVAGVALDRGDYGEGVTVGLRGIGSDMTRVEIDGLGVAGAGGAGLVGPDDRSVEFRELPSDLIKSVDVVKGATAADTEGGLAGSIQVHTRTGFDFKRRYLSGRVSANRNSIDKRWGPDLNMVFADRYAAGRLGVVATVNKSRFFNEHHRQELSVNGGSGPTLQWDFDGSPEKTFAFNPVTVSATDPAADARPAGSPYALTPRELVTVSANAKSKDACRAALPVLTEAQLGALAQGRRQAAITQRANELATCLNQWNDYTPTLVRSAIKRQDDERLSGDIRFDYRVDDRLALYLKGTRQSRVVWDTWMTHSLGNIGANSDPAGVVVDATHHVLRATIADGAVFTDKQLDRIDTANTYLQLGGNWRAGRLKAEGFVGRVASDFQREARRISLGHALGPVTMQRLPSGLWTYELPAGAAYDPGNAAAYAAVAPQTGRAAAGATVNNPAAPAYTPAQLPLTGAGYATTYTPTAGETREYTAKFDAGYALAGLVPFLPAVSKLRFGAQRRDYDNRYWSHIGYQVSSAAGTFGQPGYVAPVVVPSPRLRESGLYPCQDTAGSLAPGGLPCAYGYTPSTALATPRDGRTAVTPGQFAAIVAQVMANRTAPLFSGAGKRPAGQVPGWYDLDILKAFELAGIRNDDPGCLKSCTANDGKVYAQPVNALSEKVDAAYLMAEFDTADLLPGGLRIEGNAGVRAVRTRVRGTGLLTITAITKTAAFDPANPALAQGVNSTSVTSLTSLDRRYTDYLPSFNAATWLVPDRLVLRYGWAKMIGRPKVSQIVPNGTCTYDERLADLGEAMDCTTTLGNPGLKPWSSKNHHLGLEYYPDDDTLFTLAHFRHDGRRGAPRQAVLTDQQLFQGSGVTDPATGQALAGYRFSVPTLVNGEGVSRTGWELAVKSAMPKLPGDLPAYLPAYLLPYLQAFLRHTGIDLNVSKSRPRNDGAQYRDLNSGAVLPPVFEPRRTVNLSLWYDDGTFSARVAAQVVGERLLCIAPCGGTGPAHNYPADGATRVLLPYVPGLPIFGRETRYLDARIAWRPTSGIEVFADMRNLGKTLLRTDTGKFAVHEDGSSNVMGIGYGGVRLAVGMTFRY